VSGWRTAFALTLAIAAVAAGALGPGAARAPADTTWLCRPGLSDQPCTPGLATTRFSPSGQILGTVTPAADRRAAADCFYVYPTVSDQPTVQATLSIDPEIRSIALYQAGRYSEHCRVFAPVYPQLTIAGLRASRENALRGARSAYRSVRSAWRTYLRRYNRGRPVVLLGHSQGTYMLTRLVREEIDPSRRRRGQLVSAILLGGGVTVRRGHDIGGSFRHIPACRAPRQTGCVIAYNTFDGPVPKNALFGRGGGRLDAALGIPQRGDDESLCTNPAALRGGAGALDTIFPSAPFAPGTLIATGIALLGLPLPTAPTPWLEIRGGYEGRCTTGGGASVLRITPRGGAPEPKPSPDPTWGLHLMDGNVALGDLVDLVGTQTRAFARRAR